MADKKIILTPEAREQLEKEYRDLIDVQRPDVIEKLTLARSQGDLSENADYDAARDRQGQIEARIAQIEQILNNAVSAEEVGLGSNSKKIGIGDVVTFEEVATGEKSTVRIVGQVGADPFAEPRPSPTSPRSAWPSSVPSRARPLGSNPVSVTRSASSPLPVSKTTKNMDRVAVLFRGREIDRKSLSKSRKIPLELVVYGTPV